MYQLDLTTLGNNLKNYRKSRNFTLDELGKIIHKSRATVSKYEKCEIIPDILTLLEICNSSICQRTYLHLVPRHPHHRPTVPER